MVSPLKTQVVNGLDRLFGLWGHNIDVSDQDVFILKNTGLRNDEGKKINISNPLTVYQRRSGYFLFCDDGPP